jgi:hypothetical protein
MSEEIEIQKIGNPQKQGERTAQFPPFPRLYLELIENKSKIKPHLVNKEYKPRLEMPQEKPVLYKQLKDLEEQLGEENRDSEKSNERRESKENLNTEKIDTRKYVPRKLKHDESQRETDDEDKESHLSSTDGYESDRSYPESEPKSSDELEEPHEKIREIRREEYLNETHDDYPPEFHKEEHHDEVSREEEPRDDVRKEHRYKSSAEEPNDDYHSKYEETSQDSFKDLLSNKRPLPSYRSSFQEPDLADIMGTKQHIPSIDYVEEDREMEDKKRELLFEFKKLERRGVEVPKYTMHTSYKTMKSSYDDTTRFMQLDVNVFYYKKLLIVGFWFMEYLLGKYAKLDMDDFTKSQIEKIQVYEQYLFEMGSKSILDMEDQWPVEVKLVGMVLLNTAMFIVGKVAFKHTGQNINHYLDMIVQSPEPPKEPEKKRRMNGPKVY